MAFSLKNIVGEITGRNVRKRREKDLQKNIEEQRQEIAGSSKYLTNLLSNLISGSQAETSRLERERQSRQLGLTELIGKLRGESETGREALLSKLRGGIGSAFGQFGTGETGLEDRLRQAILGSLGESRTGLESLLGQKETGIQGALNQYLSGEFAQNLPEIESSLASRGLSIRGGSAAEGLGKELARLGGIRFGALSDLARERYGSLEDQLRREAQTKQALEGQLFGTGREDLLNRLQQSLNIGQQEAGLTREDMLRGQQIQFEDYLRNLGFSRENEQMERQFGYGLRGQQLPLEQQLKQMALIPFQTQANLAQQQLEGAQAREGGFLGGLAGLGGLFLSPAIGSLTRRFFPSSQDKYMDTLIKQIGGQSSGPIGSNPYQIPWSYR